MLGDLAFGVHLVESNMKERALFIEFQIVFLTYLISLEDEMGFAAKEKAGSYFVRAGEPRKPRVSISISFHNWHSDIVLIDVFHIPQVHP